eukprot:TRINITY_DN33612_c0_g1_i1.p1 TRINITY_DN33612_c0_g1~~TRINITY_DN33612_c0_g1_i1.p1  ORF type:complete len:235 (+),score=81.27 TRINITY_DN33612_c0_g1_i1:80-706(+)
MACCLIPFSGDPLDGEPRRPNQFQVPMQKAPMKEPLMCCFGFFCPCCAAMKMRHRALDTAGKWPEGYSCCQGTVPSCLCFKPGEMGEEDNAFICLCLEAWFCTGCAASATYGFVMTEWQLENDPCYNKFVRFSNFMQMLACICSILAIFINELADAAQCVRCVADITFRSLMGCITSQVEHELDYQCAMSKGDYGAVAAGPVGEPPMK